jgi:hypothetical protein
VVEVLEPIFGLLLQAPALPEPTVRLYLDELLPGIRRFELLALSAWAGLDSLLTPRDAPFRSLVDIRRNSWLPRFVKAEPSTPVVLPWPLLSEGHPALFIFLAVRAVVERRDTAVFLRAAVIGATPASLTAALSHLPSSSPPFFRAQSSNPSEAPAGREAATMRSRNSGTIDTLM